MIELASNDQIVSLSVIDNDKINKNAKKTKDEKSELKAKEKFVLSISENGYVKRPLIQITELLIEAARVL